MKKKVNNLTVEELEEYFTKVIGLVPDYISIYWYDVRAIKYNPQTNQDVIVSWLKREDEIDLDDKEKNDD